MKQYRIFTNDCRSNRYSCFTVISALSFRNAISIAAQLLATLAPRKIVVLPEGKVDKLFIGDEPEGGRFLPGTFARYGRYLR